MSHTSPTLTQLDQYRQQFPGLIDKVYFNYGGQGTMPQGAIAAIHRAHDYVQRSGPFSGEINSWIMEEEKRVREAIAAELHVPPTTITLTENVSMGCNIAMWGLDWQAGDHLLLSDCEHQSVIAIALALQHRFGIEVTTCPLMATLNGGDPVEVIQSHLRPNTRLVAISHILWNTGQVLPLEDIVQACHTYSGNQPVHVLVDAAQSVGVLPLNLTELGADFYAFTGHKWWCGPAGLGGLYIRPEILEHVQPVFVGWRGITRNQTGYPTGYHPDGRRFEVATSDYTLYGGLQAAIAVHHQWGMAAERYQRIRELSHYLWQRLCDLPHTTCLRTAPPEAGLVSFQHESGQHQRLVQFLEKHGFLLRTILDPSCVRACVHYFTLESELDQLIHAIQSFT